MSTYNPNIPMGNTLLSVDYANIQKNFNQLNITYGVDHVALTDNTVLNGVHKYVHLHTVTGVSPPGIPACGAIYGDSLSGDIQLFYKSGLGVISQLTGALAPSATPNGFVYLPGGVLLQWGSVNAPGSSGGPIAFPTPFLNNVFSVQFTMRRDGSNTAQGMYLNGAPILTGFSYNGSSGSSTTLFWMAVGN